MNITNPPKALIALVGLVCLTVLLAVNAAFTDVLNRIVAALQGLK